LTLFFDIETEGLNPYIHKILTIQVKRDDEIKVWKLWEEKNEQDMIDKVLDFLFKINNNTTICGYNCLKFDVPFIVSRLSQSVLLNESIYCNFYNKKWFDLYQYLGDDYVSLNRWSKYYDIERSCNIEGKNIPYLYISKNYDDIIDHAIDDLLTCEKLVLVLQKRIMKWQ
jgi:uncharacterized protein YprB with RNaseH-like and TPR domain